MKMTIQKSLAILLATLFFQTNNAFCATSDWHENQSKGAKTSLIASFYQGEKGEKKLIAAIHFKIVKGWKIYGANADADGIGLPPSLDFSGSKNYSKHEIIWPTAKIGREEIGKESIKYSYYENEVLLPVEIGLIKIGEETKLALQLSYGLCKDICVAANENFSLNISPEEDVAALLEIQKFYPHKITEEAAPSEEKNYSHSLISAILLAIFGGAILNIMPCVLPVLSIKLMSIIDNSRAKISRIRFAFLSTIFGILFSFITFAAITSAIKTSGDALGWGLQFQNPYFLIFLTLVLTVLTGNLLGIFHITFEQFLATILNKKISEGEKKKNIFVPNFLSGILAVLLATPCSAPFLGSAISFALTQEISGIFIIFLAIGIGFALPYFLLLITPKLVYFLPKPGMWMIRFKQILAGFLAATIIWLIYVLSHNIGAMPAFAVAALSISLLACFKFKSLLTRILLFATIFSAAFFVPMKLHHQQKIAEEKYNEIWIKFDENKISEFVAEGKTVVVDVTADWCLTCKFNKIRVLQDDEVMAKLKEKNIIAMRGDITKPDEKIIEFLRKKNRFAIPFNAVYGPNAKDGLLASELLNKKKFLELIKKAQK